VAHPEVAPVQKGGWQVRIPCMAVVAAWEAEAAAAVALGMVMDDTAVVEASVVVVATD